MKRYLISSLLCLSFLHAQTFEIKDFESDIFSKEGNKLRGVTLSIWLEGEGLDRYGYQIKDALNIVLSSFYLEDLLTSKGKEGFKKSFKQYLKKKYSITLDNLYFNELKRSSRSLDIDALILALKEAGFIQKGKSVKKVFDSLEN